MVSSGCYKKILSTGCLINNRTLFLTVLEAAKFKIEAPADLVFGENLLPDSQVGVFHCVLTGQKG